MSLRQRRELLGFTQLDVAERSGTSKEYYSQIETGRVTLPKIELRREISRVLGIRHIDFLQAQGLLDDWEVPGFDATAPEPDPQIEALVHLVRTLDLTKNGRQATLSNILQFWASEDAQPAR